MSYIKRLSFICVLLFFLAGCGGISLTPSYHSDGTYLYVHKGDTLYSLAKKNNIPLRDLIEENHLKAPYTLAVGQKLRIPKAQTHTVQKGETLYGISRKYNMSVSTLSRLNHLSEPYTISVGQVLKVNHTAKTPVKTASTNVKSKTKTTSATPSKTTTVAAPRRTVSVPKAQANKKFAWPVKGKIVSAFGKMQNGMQNDGINIAAAKGTAVTAAESGTVGYAGSQLKGYGNLILIRHDNGWMTAYAHNETILVKKDQKVKKGQKIATVGKTGNVKTPQLHFEIRYQTKVVNPQKYLR